MPESVEGQGIARDVLAELKGAWERFQAAYQDRLLGLAARRLRSDRRLREAHQANDLVQTFLLEKVLRHLASMLGPTADGRQPLWPRLSRSFVNFCHSVRQRTPQRPVSLPDASVVAAPAPQAEPGLGADTLASRLARRAVMFQNAFAEVLSGSLPLYHLLLLSERLLLAERVAVTLATADGSLPVGLSVPTLVEELDPWQDADKFKRLPRTGLPLRQAWQRLRAHFRRPPYRADGYAVADLLGVRRTLWDKWVERARERVLRHAGAELCREFCPHWPPRLLNRSVPPSRRRKESDSP